MLHKTRGIVLHHIRYSESSLIVRIYTEMFGLQSYLVKGARSKKASLRSSMFQPLTLLELVVYHRQNSDLQHIREASVAEPFHSMASDLRKSTIAIFLAELLFKSLRDADSSSELFDFLANSLHFFDMQEEGIEYFHLYFLLKLSRFLGFQPQGVPRGPNAYFDLREGKYADAPVLHTDQVSDELSMSLWRVSNISAADIHTLSIPRNTRDELLSVILLYYQIHLSGMGSIKSLEVLREVFR